MPKPSTFHTIETITAQSARSASSPNHTTGLATMPRSISPLVDQAEIVAEQPVPEQARDAEPDDHRHEHDARA